MEDKQDIFEKLNQIKDDYEPNPDLMNSVLEKINQRESTVVFKKTYPKWLFYALCGLLVVVVGVILMSVYLIKSDKNTEIKITIYSAEEIEIEKFNELDEFVAENNLNLKYFKDLMVTNKIAKIKDTDIFAYVAQEFFSVGSSGFDYINLYVVLLKNSEFEFYNDFKYAIEQITVSDIEVHYSVSDLTGQNNYKAKFNLDDKSYFLEITSGDSGIEVLEKYINQLIN